MTFRLIPRDVKFLDLFAAAGNGTQFAPAIEEKVVGRIINVDQLKIAEIDRVGGGGPDASEKVEQAAKAIRDLHSRHPLGYYKSRFRALRWLRSTTLVWPFARLHSARKGALNFFVAEVG